jgi:hypothetical protein
VCEECSKNKQTLRSALYKGGEGEALPSVHEVLQSPGQPLDSTTRAFFEPRFGHDFSHVRIHTNAKARDSAQELNALAYTVGQDVVFGGGHFTPETIQGRRLLAHELTHVVQQSPSSTRTETLEIAYPRIPSELEAERTAESIEQEHSFKVKPVGHIQLSRQQPGVIDSPRSPFAKYRKYDRSQFGGRFDAEVSTIPLCVKLS